MSLCDRHHRPKSCWRSRPARTAHDLLEQGQVVRDHPVGREAADRITATGGPNLLEYALDPLDFGQTVENLFRISFLIKEGTCGVEPDEDGLPTLCKLTDFLTL